MSDRFNLNLSDEVGAAVRAEASRTETTMTDVISKMVRFYTDTAILRDANTEIIARNKTSGEQALIVLVNN